MLNRSFKKRLFLTSVIALLLFSILVEYFVINTNYFILLCTIIVFALGLTSLIDYFRKKINQNILYKIQQYQAVFNFANNGIAMLDTQGKFTDINNFYKELLAYNKYELLGTSITDYIDPKQQENILTILETTLSNGFVQDYETICTNKEGKSIPINISMQLLPDKEHILMVVNSLKDKRRLQKLNKKLKKKINKEVKKNIRIQQIRYNEKLQNARLSSIGKLAAGVTHEINTPLTYIKGNLEMILEDLKDEDFASKEFILEDMKTINSGILRIENIIQSMREVSSQNEYEEKQATNIYETIIVALTLGFKRIEQTVELKINKEVFSPMMDKNAVYYISLVQRQKLEQVWIIIINNALDVLSQIEAYQDRKLDVEIFREEDEIIVKFIDNAGGIKEEILNRLFEPFVSSKKHEGVGIGLNIAKKIIENQQGSIHAYNENDGAVFEIRIPSYSQCIACDIPTSPSKSKVKTTSLPNNI